MPQSRKDSVQRPARAASRAPHPASPQPPPPARKPPGGYTVRLDRETKLRFEALRQNRKLRTIGEEAFTLWMRREEANAAATDDLDSTNTLEESIRENLVSAVTDHLRSNTAWAEAAIKAASLMDPVISVFFRRTSHFLSEKQALSTSFMPWLVGRILHHIDQGRDIRLVVESGTTLKVSLDHLGPCLHGRAEVAKLPPKRIQVLTNNFPGAESYESYASTVSLAGHTLSALVPCELVPGRALQEYAAVVGDKAETYLKNWCESKRGDRSIVRIGLAVGNWVMLEGNPPRPVPLARGAGHKSFKEEVFKNCDEIYLISPLCKIIRADRRKSAKENLSDFNENLKKTATKEIDQKGDYSRVDLDALGIDQGRIKLVTTYREKATSIVRLHSKLVMDTLNIIPKDTYDGDLQKAVRDLDHVAYLHDVHADKPFKEQLMRELPHERTREGWFRKLYFDIEAQD